MIELPPDHTFWIQVASFLIFWQLMRWALFGPVQRALRARAERTTGDLARAEALQREAATLALEIDAALSGARAEGHRQADEIRRRSEAEEQRVAERFRDDATALLERERSVTRRQVEAVRAPLREDAERLAGAVVAKVLGRVA